MISHKDTIDLVIGKSDAMCDEMEEVMWGMNGGVGSRR